MEVFILFRQCDDDVEVDSVYRREEDAEHVRQERQAVALISTFVVQKHKVINDVRI
jgi:hypothetical protein